jgi:hypothetical protein
VIHGSEVATVVFDKELTLKLPSAPGELKSLYELINEVSKQFAEAGAGRMA